MTDDEMIERALKDGVMYAQEKRCRFHRLADERAPMANDAAYYEMYDENVAFMVRALAIHQERMKGKG